MILCAMRSLDFNRMKEEKQGKDRGFGRRWSFSGLRGRGDWIAGGDWAVAGCSDAGRDAIRCKATCDHDSEGRIREPGAGRDAGAAKAGVAGSGPWRRLCGADYTV